jgi:hypothetical protein
MDPPFSGLPERSHLENALKEANVIILYEKKKLHIFFNRLFRFGML